MSLSFVNYPLQQILFQISQHRFCASSKISFSFRQCCWWITCYDFSPSSYHTFMNWIFPRCFPIVGFFCMLYYGLFEFKIITLSFPRFCHCHNTTKKQEWKKAKTLHASENSNALQWFQNWTDMSPLSLEIISWLAHYHIITWLVKKSF